MEFQTDSDIIVRAFRFDNYVPPINWEIAEGLDWDVERVGAPTLIARYQRSFLDLNKKGISKAKKLVVRSLRCFTNGPHEATALTITSPEASRPDMPRAENRTSKEAREAQDRLFGALRDTFSNSFIESKIKVVLREILE